MKNQNIKPLAVAIAAVLSASSMTAFAQEEPEAPVVANPEITMEEVIVRGVRAADLNARNAERVKDIYSSVISQDDVGNFADQNVAEALQRLPGVTLQKSDGQGEFVNVRGLGPGFVGVTMNNSELSSASDSGRAVGLNTIPADLMGSIEVLKSLTPDMDLNSIAGKVNVNSLTAFDRPGDTLKMSLQTTMQDQRGEAYPKATIVGTRKFADDTFGVAASFSFEERATDINQIKADNGELVYIRQSQPFIGDNDYDAVRDAEPARSSTQYMERYFGGVSSGADPYIDNERMLIPSQFEVRQDDSVRTRMGSTLDFRLRPEEGNSEYYVRFAYTDYTDEELALRENYSLINGNDFNQIGVVDLQNNFFALGNTDLRHRVFIQELNDVTQDFAFGGENIVGDWTFDYEFHVSKSERETPDDRRAQFRTRSLPMYGQLYQDDIRAAVIDQSQMIQLVDATGAESGSMGGMGGFVGGVAEGVFGYEIGARRQPNMAYDNILLESVTRTDDLQTFSLNIRRDFEDMEIFGSSLNYLKFGIQAKERDRVNDQSELNVNQNDISPSRVCINDDGSENRECFTYQNTRIGIVGLATEAPRFDRFDHDLVTLNGAEYAIAAARLIPENLDPERSGATSQEDDYEIYENSFDVYGMAEFQIMDDATIIAGARYVETEYGSTGWLTLRHDRFVQFDNQLRDMVIPLGSPGGGGFAVKEYDGFYPGIHLRYEVSDDILFRTSLWTSYNRPEFDAAAVSAKFDGRIEVCTDAPLQNEDPCGNNLTDDLGANDDNGNSTLAAYMREHFTLAPGGNSLELGNSELSAMQAGHFDASLSWYGEGGNFFEVAVFYKEIEDFIVDIRGVDAHRQSLPAAIGEAIDQIDVNVNGSATPNRNQNVVGVDSNFVFRDVTTSINGDVATVYGLETGFSRYFDNGFFLNGNLTLLNSSADVGSTVRVDELRLPNQADVNSNITVGWENDAYSARVIANYRSKILDEIGSCSQADLDADAEWARLNDASNPGALDGAAGDGTVYPENCKRWADTYHDAIFSIDFKATYNTELWDTDVKFYFDVLNITEDVDVFYWQGNQYTGGNVLSFTEGIGRTFQAGVNISIW